MNDDNNKLVPLFPAGFLDRLAEDPNAGALVALGLAGLGAFERNQEAERQQHVSELEAEREDRRLMAEERRASAERAEKEKAAQRAHELTLWKHKQRFLVVLGPFCCFAIVVVGVYLILNGQAVLGASIAGAAGAALVGMAKDLTRGISSGALGGENDPQKTLSAKSDDT